MIAGKFLGNRFIISLLSFLIISIIGVLDFITGSEISFAIFYFLPVVLHAYHRSTTKIDVFINVFLATIIWLIAELYSKEYSSNLIVLWNILTRFFVYIIAGLVTLGLKEQHNKMLQMNAESKRLNEEKNKFIGIAAHDLRNPIGTIFAFSELLLSKDAEQYNAKTFKILNYIKTLSENTLQLLKELLDVSKIEAGVVEISPTNQDYIEFIRKCILLNQILADKKEISIRLESTEKEIIFPFDEHYLSEVVNNLITNAVKYSFLKSEIIVRVSITETNSVKTEIIDRGKGIPKEEQTSLFNYFQKTSTTPTAGEQSTGLGLAIARKIITSHKGNIGVISEADKGSNFYFELFR